MKLFFDLIKVSLGHLDKLSRCPSEFEWEELYTICQQQAVAGVVFPTLNHLSKHGQKPPLDLLIDWIRLSEDVKQQNRMVNRNAVDLSKDLEKDGFECYILKGQGNAMMYPEPLLRTPGDIDVWVRSEVRGKKVEVRDIIRYVKERHPEGRAQYHHIDYGIVNGVEVEVHYRPSFMFNPVHNRRLQKFFVTQIPQISQIVEFPECVGSIRVPNREFNIIFQLSHVYNHLLHEGIGLRQIVDYYYVLKSHTDSTDHTDLYKTLRSLGLEKIAGAMMWVMHEVLGMEEKYLIAPKDEKRGKVLLSEIMRGGNFGSYDIENQKADSRLKKAIQRFRRDIRLVRYFPSECLWEPVFRSYHFFWRMKY